MTSKPKGIGYQAGMNAIEYEAAKLRASIDTKIIEAQESLKAARFSSKIGELHAGLLKVSNQIDWCFGRVHEIKMLEWVLQHPQFRKDRNAKGTTTETERTA